MRRGLLLYTGVMAAIIAGLAAQEPLAKASAPLGTAVHRSSLPLMLRASSFCSSSAPQPIAPANGALLDTLVPLFAWDLGSSVGVGGMGLEVATDPEFHDFVALLSTGPHDIAQYRFSFNFEPGTYYWRTWFWCESEGPQSRRGPYSDVWSFATSLGGAAPLAALLIAPANGVTVTSFPVVLRWAAVDGALEYIVFERPLGEAYQVEVWVTDTEYETGGFGPGTTDEWWVMARNEYALSEPSEVWSFTSPATATSAELGDSARSTTLADSKGAAIRIQACDQRPLGYRDMASARGWLAVH